ncbi:MAG: hypothetical protein B7Y12_01945 [Rhizobiales bacterium 24-66-13]|jgi:transcriptional regulator with XRE-family HTH domain|nr:MAG: hypothetical protein B7Y61_00980 [Rhizobiales bacterium 35-66-30]OYZ82778.1 MAG: hypothetical protein B7Y12_01945 [Rhizobiales bacterium 24-66-13]OZB11811.1 MAG: hypothetical protein B7X67_01925 [Rhizobiales bacterium 39-66-18]HQS09519.1 helix-turn-helix transcriptional regulator [Xanthobacteraceae bacterium]HQS46817.1 helix-turn-helix transcriptional regulator [Xanthobacteraceae bacterium]
MNSLNSDLAHRIRICAELAGSGDELSRKTAIPRRTLESYLAGDSEPKASRLVAIARAVDVTIEWLAAGEGSQFGALHSSKSDVATEIDPELMGRVTDAISRLYKDERISLAPVDLGRLIARKYAEICAAADTEEERLTMIKLIVAQLRTDLRNSAAEPGTGKRSA